MKKVKKRLILKKKKKRIERKRKKGEEQDKENAKWIEKEGMRRKIASKTRMKYKNWNKNRDQEQKQGPRTNQKNNVQNVQGEW